VKSKPATSRTPFGHGRMEHVAPLVISIFLFVTGIRIGEEALHQVIDPHELHYWAALPWLLLGSIVIKLWMGQFIRFLGRRTNSHAIITTAFHHSVEAIISLTVVAGLVAGRYLHLPVLDGAIGLLVSLWLLYLGAVHARRAVIPLLGEAPSRETVEEVRTTATAVEGVEDVHEVIVHDYGSMYLVSLHAEIPEEYGSFHMHEIAELAEAKLRERFGGEAVVHTDPLLKQTHYVRQVEAQFASLLEGIPEVLGYHDFRVIAKSEERIIIVADIDVSEETSALDYPRLQGKIEELVQQHISRVAYSSFYITPKFAY
jgi:cation diffusion facilitator family transporter